MGLSCDCDIDWDPDPGDWYWNSVPRDYKTFEFKRRKRCCSCDELIGIGALTTEHTRVKTPGSDVEINIYGEDGEIAIASDWMCEKCSDLFLSLVELGYCVNPRDKMTELVEEHAREHSA